jgi:hypothetical protein
MSHISSTARERIVDTLDPPPHNSTMPQLSSTDRLLMAANDKATALKHPQPEVPFAQVGYDTITALTQLASILKICFKNHKRQNLLTPLSRKQKTDNQQHWCIQL